MFTAEKMLYPREALVLRELAKREEVDLRPDWAFEQIVELARKNTPELATVGNAEVITDAMSSWGQASRKAFIDSLWGDDEELFLNALDDAGLIDSDALCDWYEENPLD